LEWELAGSAASAFESSTVAEIVTVSDEAVVMGNGYETGAFGMWRSADGEAWEVVETSSLDGFSVVGPVASDADALVMAVSEATPARQSTRFARWTPVDGWSVEQEPVLGTSESPLVGACPDAPDTALEWAAIPGAVGAECFGDRPITFTAWWSDVPTHGWGSTWSLEPRWLWDYFPLSFVEADTSQGIAVLSPDANVDGTPGSWQNFTGHWADAEASACRTRPDATFPYHGLGGTSCRGSSTFVLTDIARAP
jgi:hypothetical protein